jgi:tRNA pseudouridine55 synthase
MNGFINLYKPSGMTSAYALNKIKKLLGKKVKCGHMGTLDPMACGVLPVAIGKSTRLFDYLLDKDKRYVATFTFGYETDSLDAEGKIVRQGGKIPTLSEVQQAAKSLIGVVDQVPPAFSAKNVDGTRSYVLARKGIEVELKPKKVEITNIIVEESNVPNSYTFTVECKGGTYIRSICRDVAYKLNTYATMTALLRQKSGLFTVENSVLAQDINSLEDIKNGLIAPEKVVNLPKIELNNSTFDDLINGRPCYVSAQNGLYNVLYNDVYVGVGEVIKNNLKLKAYIKD